MKKIENAILEYLRKKAPQELYKHLWLFLGAFTLLLGLASYYIYQTSASLISEIALVHKKTHEARDLVHRYNNILELKTNIFKHLDSKTPLDIKGYLETVCRQQDLAPESNWTPSKNPLPFNRDLEEIILQARLKNITMQKLVPFLVALTQNEMVYVRSLRLIKDSPGQKVFNVELSVGTYNYKEQATLR